MAEAILGRDLVSTRVESVLSVFRAAASEVAILFSIRVIAASSGSAIWGACRT